MHSNSVWNTRVLFACKLCLQAEEVELYAEPKNLLYSTGPVNYKWSFDVTGCYCEHCYKVHRVGEVYG